MLVPEALWRHARLSKAAKELRNIYYGPQLRALKPVVLVTGETHNFTYDLTEDNLRYLAEMVAVATKRPAAEIASYIEEAISDKALRQHFDGLMRTQTTAVTMSTVRSPFGRRLGWYAIARATKPKVIVETGVERGHGALMLCAALLRNAQDGQLGRYFGTDINPRAGWLLQGEYASVGKILYGDSISSLKALNETIDLFINDSDHSAEYEAQEYEIVSSNLSRRAIVLGDNGHVTDKLALFSRQHGRNFLMFYEKPKGHWYPGAGIGISFPAEN